VVEKDEEDPLDRLCKKWSTTLRPAGD